MSSQFNYELDEKNIRSTLLNAKPSVLGESSWHEFEQNFSKKIVTHNPTSFKLPEFHLNINRNVIIPVVFILSLVGISAIVINFIDFKSADDKQVEKVLEPNPDNFKPKVTNANPVVTKTVAAVIEDKPIMSAAKNDTIPVLNNQLPKPSMVLSNTDSNSNLATVNTVETSRIKSDSNVAENINTTTVIAGENAIVPQATSQKPRRKKREEIPAEQIETMKAPELIKTETETSEPELEIKID